MIPPPPGPPPGGPGGGAWNNVLSRMYDRGAVVNIPPPPGGPVQAYNPRLHAQMAPGQTLTTIPPPPPPNEQMSATYIPQGDTYGEGVGIPAFGLDDTATWSAVSSQASWQAISSQESTSTNMTTPMDEAAGRGDRMYANAMQQQRMLSNASTATQMQSSIPPELTAQWTPDRVLMWLQANKFSKDWQETFKALSLHGAQFLELGSGRGGRGNWGMMHQQVYPRLATQCYSSGTGWNQANEREEGKRMRRLIRGLLKVENMEGPSKQGGGGHARQGSVNGGPMSAGPDADSPNVGFFFISGILSILLTDSPR